MGVKERIKWPFAGIKSGETVFIRGLDTREDAIKARGAAYSMAARKDWKIICKIRKMDEGNFAIYVQRSA